MINRFLVATDGSEAALNAARLASRIVAPKGQIVLLHVVPGLGGTALSAVDAAGLLLGGPPGGLAAEWMQKATQRGTEALAAARKQMACTTAPTIDISTELEIGRPANLILDRLEHGAFDALAIGGRGHGFMKHMLLGSVAAEVLLHSTKPILIGRQDSVRRILVATDGSEAARRAARVAGEIARVVEAPVSVISAVDLPHDTFGVQQDIVKTALREHFKSAFEAARSAAGTVLTEEKLVFAEPVQAILNETVDRGVDLVVVGRRRAATSNLGRIGSVAYRVAMGAPASVLVVP